MSTDNRQLISFLVNGRLPKDAYAKLHSFNYQLLLAAKAGSSVYENEVLKLNNCPYSRELQGHFSIRDIFIEYWDRFLILHADKKIGPAIMDFMPTVRSFPGNSTRCCSPATTSPE